MKEAEQRLDERMDGAQTLCMPMALLAQLDGVWAERHRAPVTHPLLLTFDLMDPLGAELADVFEIAPGDASRVVMVAPAHVVRWVLALIEPDLVDEVRPGRDGAALVVTLGLDCTGVMPLEELRSAVTARRKAVEEDPMTKTNTVVQAVRDELPAKPKKKKKPAKRARFGTGLFGYQSKVTVAQTRESIEVMLMKHGCDGFSYSSDARSSKASVQFRARDKVVRFELAMPRLEDFTSNEGGSRKLREEHAKHRYEQSMRQRWRALYLLVKAKLESIESKISEFSDEFLPQMVDPESNLTVAELIKTRSLIPALGSGSSIIDAEIEHAPRLNGSSHVEATA